MPLKFSRDPKEWIRNMKRTLKDIPRIAGAEAERFFKESFRRQGWHDKVFTPWQARKGGRTRTIGQNRSGRALLIKSGALRKSIRVTRIGNNYVVVGTSLPYAKVHNEGSKQVFSRRNRKNPGTHQVKMNMPRRKFMGESNALSLQIGKVIRQRMRNKMI